MGLWRARCRANWHAGFGGAGRGNGPSERAAPRPGSTLRLPAGSPQAAGVAGQRPRRQAPACPPQAAAGEAAGGRPDQAFHGGDRHLRGLRPGHAGALIAGERNPRTLAELARGRLRVKHAALVEALTGQFSDHHAWLARMLLDQIDGLSGQIDQLTSRIDQAIAAIPAANPPADGPGAVVQAGSQPARSVPDSVDPETGEILPSPLPVVDRLD